VSYSSDGRIWINALLRWPWLFIYQIIRLIYYYAALSITRTSIFKKCVSRSDSLTLRINHRKYYPWLLRFRRMASNALVRNFTALLHFYYWSFSIIRIFISFFQIFIVVIRMVWHWCLKILLVCTISSDRWSKQLALMINSLANYWWVPDTDIFLKSCN
jgi:hypothetical protein